MPELVGELVGFLGLGLKKSQQKIDKNSIEMGFEMEMTILLKTFLLLVAGDVLGINLAVFDILSKRAIFARHFFPASIVFLMYSHKILIVGDLFGHTLQAKIGRIP